MARLVHEVCSISNPFCPAAREAKIGTNYDLPSYSVQFQKLVTLSTGDTGYGYLIVDPSQTTESAYRTGAIDTVASFTVPTLGNLGYGIGTLPTDGADKTLYRVVSAGVELWDVAPRTATGGSWILHDMSNLQDRFGDTWSASVIWPTIPHVISDRRKPVSWVSRSTDPARRFRSHEDDATYLSHSAMVLVFTGDASSVVGTARITYNLEFQPVIGGTTGIASATHGGRVSRQATDLAGVVASHTEPFFLGNRDVVERKVTANVLNFVANNGANIGAAVGAVVGGPSGAAFGAGIGQMGAESAAAIRDFFFYSPTAGRYIENVD